MDRSFLSQPAVIAASRKFVCARLATYEDDVEGAYLQSICSTRSGELENSVFAILGPDAKKELIRPSRGPNHSFRNATQLAAAMDRIAQNLATSPPSRAPAALPAVRNVRLAVNVAACDQQPLIVVFAEDSARRAALEKRVRELAWSDRYIGRFIYAAAGSTKELGLIEGAKPAAGVIVVQPDRYGQKAKVLAQVAATVSGAELARALDQGATAHERFDRSFSGHVRTGHLQGVFWETAFPVTDPMEQRARERGRKRSKE